MAWTQGQLPLLYVNGGTPHIVKCGNCNVELGNERAAAKCPDGNVRFFCPPERGDDPQHSCYMTYRRSRH